MDDGQLAGYIAGGTVAGSVITMVISWFLNRRRENAETNAAISDATGKTSLIEALEARIAASEQRQNSRDQRIDELEKRIAQEVDMRLAAQEENHKLRLENHSLALRITELEFAIKQLSNVTTNPLTPISTNYNKPVL